MTTKFELKKKQCQRNERMKKKNHVNKNKQNIWKATRFFIFCAAFVSGWLKEKWK